MPRALIIDDDPSIRNVLDMTLADNNWETEGAATGEEGCDRFSSGSWDVVLVDKNMPGIDGVEVIRRIRQRDSDVGIVMMTAMASVDSAIKTMVFGVDAYIEKPFTDIDTVVRTAQAAFDRATSRRRGIGQNAAVAHFRKAAEILERKGSGTTGGLRILVVSSSDPDARWIHRRLDPEIGKVCRVCSASELMTKLDELLPHLLFVDADLGSGRLVPWVSEIRDRSPNATVVVMAASPDVSLAKELIHIGVAVLLKKPLEPVEFERNLAGRIAALMRVQSSATQREP